MSVRSVFRTLTRRTRALRQPEDTRGFTMIEVLTVAVVMSTLVRISLPNFHEVLLQARAAEVVGDFEVVRIAALSYNAEKLGWPADSYVGQIPSDLAEFLPEGYSFNRPGYRLDWENWDLPSGLPGAPGIRSLLGISVFTDDAELGQAVIEFLGSGAAHYQLGSNYTFVIEGM